VKTPYSRVSLCAVAVALALPAGAGAQGPPPPTSTNGNAVTTVAQGVTTPTAFAFAGDTTFAASGPAEGSQGPTGVFTLAGGTATKVPGTPDVAFGLAYRGGKLYVSTGPQILAFSGWNGTKFSKKTTIAAPKGKFAGFNGIAFSPTGRLYAGVSFSGDKFDSKRDPSKYAQSVVSMTASGKNLRVVSRGLRQPFQLTFVGKQRDPFVSVLSQDSGKIPKDAIVKARAGQDYGFPTCLFGTSKTCRGFAQPAILLPKHSSPMGIGAIGSNLYVSLFGGLGQGPVVAKMPARGGTPKPVLQGFAAPVIALGINNGTIYVGDLTGTIYAVKA
jgi:glucose/arabinose dehydrogenase